MVTYLYLLYTSSPDVNALLGSVLRQCQAEGDVDAVVGEMFDKYCHRGLINGKVQPPSLDDIKAMLSVVNKNKTTFVIIDGLDEFDINNRTKLLNNLKEIMSTVKIMVTSHVLNHLESLQEDFKTDTIEAHDEDMDAFIDLFIKNHESLDEFAEYQERIKEVVKRQSGKIYVDDGCCHIPLYTDKYHVHSCSATHGCS